MTGIRLDRLRPGGSEPVAAAFVPTVRRSFSLHADAVRSAAPALLAHACARLRAGQPLSPIAETIDEPAEPEPTLGTLAAAALSAFGAKLSNAFSTLFRHDQWCIGVVPRPIGRLLTDSSVSEARWLPRSGRSEFLADPFAVPRAGGLTIVAEEFDYRIGIGRIAAVEWSPDRRPSSHHTVLTQPTHLSYPFLLEHGGEVYCIPESAASRQVVLHRAVSFPGTWERAAVLLDDVAALDASVVQFEGCWWLFAALKEGSVGLSLHAWHAPALTGPWSPHALNPLKIDIRSTRPAGTPFIHEGRLYRPAQDCSRTYGGAVAINRIDRLSPTEFEETVVTTIRPDPRGPFPDGLHTISAAGEFTVIDGKRRAFVPAVFREKLGAACRKALRRSPVAFRGRDGLPAIPQPHAH